MFIGPCIIAIVEEWKTNLMSLAIFYFTYYALNMFRTLIYPSSVTVLQPAKRTPPNISRSKNSNTQRTENKTTDVVIHQHSRRLLKMYILMSETCWAHNKWNKIASDIKLVFHSSTIAMMHGPINTGEIFVCKTVLLLRTNTFNNFVTAREFTTFIFLPLWRGYDLLA